MRTLLVGRPGTVTIKLEVAGTPTDFDTNPTLTIVDAAGATLFNGTVAPSPTGVYSQEIDAVDEVDTLTATLVGLVSTKTTTLTERFEVVADVLFTESELRAYDDGELAGVEYEDDELAAMHDLIVEKFESYCHRGFVQRHASAQFRSARRRDPWQLDPRDGRVTAGGKGHVRDIESVLAADDGASVAAANLDTDGLYILRTDTTWATPTRTTPFPITARWRYGISEVPTEISLAAKMYARFELVTRDISDRMVSYTDPTAGLVRLSQPGRDRPTGLPYVDEVLNEWRHLVAVA